LESPKSAAHVILNATRGAFRFAGGQIEEMHKKSIVGRLAAQGKGAGERTVSFSSGERRGSASSWPKRSAISSAQ